MVTFAILKQSKKSSARIGSLETDRGIIETPAFVPVATRAGVKALDSADLLNTSTSMVIANTFHLHIEPGEETIKKLGGLRNFMGYDGIIMTDSAGYQVFSLGFNLERKTGKAPKKMFAGKDNDYIREGTQPKNITITARGVFFRHPRNGKRLFIGPKESIRIQEKLGADIMLSFDECTPPESTKRYAYEAMRRTHDWAKVCIRTKKTGQALYGIVQGSHFKDLRQESAKFINSLNFDGFAIGGDLGFDPRKQMMRNILDWTIPALRQNLPRHLLGIGYLEDIPLIIRKGIDTFDCAVPTLFARHGQVFISDKSPFHFRKINLINKHFRSDKKPLDARCGCDTCHTYSRAYLAHHLRVRDGISERLLTIHNLSIYNSYLAHLRNEIKKGNL